MTALSSSAPSLPREVNCTTIFSEGAPLLVTALSEGKPSLPKESEYPHAETVSTALRNRWLAFGREVGDGGAFMTALSEGKPSLPREFSEGKPSLPREGKYSHAKQLSTALRNRWLAFGREVGNGGACMTALSEGKPSLPRGFSEGELLLVRERV